MKLNLLSRSIPVVLLAAIVTSASAQKTKTPVGKKTELNKEFLGSDTEEYKYLAVDPVFWRKISSLLTEDNSNSILIAGAKQADAYGVSSPEGAEGQLALGLGLYQRGYVFAAFTLWVELAQSRIGTKVGEAALFYLGRLTQDHFYDKDRLLHLLNSNEFSNLHPDIQSFVGYHKTVSSLEYGFSKWASKHKKGIVADSYWDHLFSYWAAIAQTLQGNVASARSFFEKISAAEDLNPKLREQASLQLARLQFEDGNFEPAFEMYSAIQTLSLREQGRIQLERAWSKYYSKDYSKALGILKALQSPFYLPSLTFERHILEMVIYKELCHYQAVEGVVKRFRKTYGPSLKAIRQRKPLREDRQLLYLALMNKDVQETANLIDAIRKEYDQLKRYSWKFTFYDIIIDNYKNRDQYLQTKLDRHLEERVRVVAEELLDAEEQIEFLEYSAKLDRLRIARGQEDRSYKSEKIDYIAFNKFFWPVENEYWLDELESYKMLISSRCGERGEYKSPKLLQLEEKFK